MKSILLVASAIAASVHGAVIEARQRGGKDGTEPSPHQVTPAPVAARQISLGPPRQSVTFWPNPGGDDHLGECGLDAFDGHTAEASSFCSSILRSGTATLTATYTSRGTRTTTTTQYTTLPRSTSAAPSSTTKPTPPTSTKPTSTPPPVTSTSSAPPSTTSAPGCGLVGYVKTTAAYYFDSTGTKNNFTACSAYCKADTKCKGFGYGEANCLLFDIPVTDNVNYNPMSPYTFYNVDCPKELPVKHKRQINISLSLGAPKDLSSACSCLITKGPAETTVSRTVTVTSDRFTVTQTVIATVTPRR